MRWFQWSLVVALFAGCPAVGEVYVPEKGSSENDRRRKAAPVADDPSLPNVLIIGDSISIGYTPTVRRELEGIANVIRPKGNHQGTTWGVVHIDSLIAARERWDVVHFNWGLHDLKHVNVAGTSENSASAADPQQADVATYRKNLETLVARLRGTGATLIFASTTPYPDIRPAGRVPLRKAVYAETYNASAKEVMEAAGVEINDLHAFALPRLNALQRPNDVHFKPAGKRELGREVAKRIRARLPSR